MVEGEQDRNENDSNDVPDKETSNVFAGIARTWTTVVNRARAASLSMVDFITDSARAVKTNNTHDVLTSFVRLISETVVSPLSELNPLDVYTAWKTVNASLAAVPVHPRDGDTVSRDAAFELSRRAKEAMSPYGAVHNFLLNSSWSAMRESVDESLLREQEKLIEKHRDVLPSAEYLAATIALDSDSGDDVLIRDGGDGEVPFHFVAWKQSCAEVLLCIRGTVALSDIVTDLNHQPATLPDGHEAHNGMLQAARKIAGSKNVRSAVLGALQEDQEPENNGDIRITIVGHSLGAGVATLVGWLWKSEGQRSKIGQVACARRLHVYAFGPPATVSAPLAAELDEIVDAVVLGDDIVPRMSFASIRNAQTAVRALGLDSSLREEAHNALQQNDMDRIEKVVQMLRCGFHYSDALCVGGSVIHIQSLSGYIDARRVSRRYVEEFIMKDKLVLDHMPAAYCSALAQAGRRLPE